MWQPLAVTRSGSVSLLHLLDSLLPWNYLISQIPPGEPRWGTSRQPGGIAQTRDDQANRFGQIRRCNEQCGVAGAGLLGARGNVGSLHHS